jgi:hypothetical protein
MSSNSVLRRYTPPTCTLEIVSQGLPLFRLVGRSVLKQLNFSLNFDDPRLPEEQRITIHGDKTQLEALSQEVKTYIHDFLSQKPENFPESHTLFSTQQETSIPPEIEQNESTQLKSGETEIINLSPQQNFSTELPQTNPNPAIEDNYQPTSTPNTTKLPDQNLNLSPVNSKIYLKPRNLLSHDLFLGSLATQESGPAINLTLLQLFDLATALEEYKAEQKGLPKTSRPIFKHKLPPYWAISAAMVAVTVGLTAGIATMRDQRKPTTEPVPTVINPTTNPTIDPNQINPNNEQPQMAAVPLPLPSPTPGLASPETLPSPSGLAGNLTPNPTATPTLGNNTPGTPPQIPPVGITPNPTTSQTGNLPPGTYRIGSNSNSPGVPSVSPNSGAVSQGMINIPVDRSSTTAANRSPAPRTPVKPQTRSTPQTTPPRQTDVQMFARESSTLPPAPPRLGPETPPPLPPTVLPTVLPTTSSTSPSEQNTQTQVKPTPAATPKPQENSQLFSLGHQLGNSTAEPLLSNTVRRPTETLNNQDSEVAATENSGASNVATLTTDNAPKGNSLFDQIPQIAEARQFFEQRWQPPSSLTQEQIEYTLAVNADGTIRQITPRGQVAQIYLDRTQMPLMGEPFVSPVEGGRKPEILLILHKNGKVETRLQTLN